MSLMIRAATRTAAHTAAAPLTLLLRSAALRLSSLRASRVSLHRSSFAIRSPPLAAPFSTSSASSARSLPLPRRVSSASGSAVTAASAPSIPATPRADCHQSAKQSRSLSAKRVGSSVAAPSAASSSSSLFRRSAHSPTGLRSTHFSAAAVAQAARGQTGTRSFSSQAGIDLSRSIESRMQSAIVRLDPIAQSQIDPVVSVVLHALKRLVACAPSSIALELDQLLLRLSDVALWMPIPHGARVGWLVHPPSLPFAPSPLAPPSRIPSAIKRLTSVDHSEQHYLAAGLLNCMQLLTLASLELGGSTTSDRQLMCVQRAQLFLVDFAEWLPLERVQRWIAPKTQQEWDLQFEWVSSWIREYQMQSSRLNQTVHEMREFMDQGRAALAKQQERNESTARLLSTLHAAKATQATLQAMQQTVTATQESLSTLQEAVRSLQHQRFILGAVLLTAAVRAMLLWVTQWTKLQTQVQRTAERTAHVEPATQQVAKPEQTEKRPSTQWERDNAANWALIEMERRLVRA